MKQYMPFLILPLLAAALLSGCSRTIEDVDRWEAAENTEKLIKAFNDPKAEIRLAAAEALGKLRAESAIDPLASLFDDPETNVVYTAARALVAMGNDEAAGHLMLALRLDQNNVRLLAATALGEQMRTNAVSELARALDDSTPAVALAAAESLKKIGAETASPALAAKLQNASEELALACIDALKHTGGAAAADGLIPAMQSDLRPISSSAKDALVAIGEPCIPALLEALKNINRPIRNGALDVLSQLQAVPEEGGARVWYKLARTAMNETDELDPELIEWLSSLPEEDLDTVLQAAAHPVENMRKHAFRALEMMGEPILPKVAAAVARAGNAAARNWYKNRGEWQGGPSWKIDLWAALAALNPAFEIDSATREYLRLRGTDAQRILNDHFTFARAYTPWLIDLLDDPENQPAARKLLTDHGGDAALPLIAALTGNNEPVSIQAAEILGELEDRRAAPPLIHLLAQKLDAGQDLTDASYYKALIRLNVPEAEAVLQKVRPNSDRSIQVFENQYPDLRVMSAETKDTEADRNQAIRFRLGYLKGYSMGQAHITFEKNEEGNWMPAPPLPEQPEQ